MKGVISPTLQVLAAVRTENENRAVDKDDAFLDIMRHAGVVADAILRGNFPAIIKPLGSTAIALVRLSCAYRIDAEEAFAAQCAMFQWDGGMEELLKHVRQYALQTGMPPEKALETFASNLGKLATTVHTARGGNNGKYVVRDVIGFMIMTLAVLAVSAGSSLGEALTQAWDLPRRHPGLA